ncbi:hypothetical protein D3H65_08375 [Paraflavitalea soli]|uniref:YfhO family protein n=1 Tax=Paraflavitalea soli TaxID=2315862 RepID=A0A3B7MK32_9BACT|nr:YfhO family protein [Paraflavitalea soli]AXY73997.1 hypothetical protein D3H65_08375 [Paraflavitalea soli]
MNKTLWQRLTPHVIAIAIFFVISCVYCLPVFKGEVLGGHDAVGWKAMSQQSFEFKEKHGHFPLWTNSMLSGMPAYQIAFDSKYNITVAHLGSVFTLFLPIPAGFFFLSCISFYLLCLVMGTRNWIGVLGSLGYAFASYNAIIVAVGHISKFGSMAYAPAILAGLILLSQRKYIIGFLITLVATTCMFYQNHVQVMYYTFLIAGFLGLAFLIKAIREKEFKPFLISVGLSVLAIALSAASYAKMLLPTSEYVKETMRGGRSELTPLDKSNKSQGGLDKDYAFTWSYGISETLTFIVPRIYGGSSPGVLDNQYVNEIGDNSKVAKVFAEKTGMPEDQANEFAKQYSPYWGAQPSTSGTVYLGAIICFLFIVGLVFYRQWHLGWIIAATILGILLAWGSNFKAFNYFLFDHLPYYNKFRAPSIALIIPQLTVPLLAALGLNELLNGSYDATVRWKKFKQSLYITGGLLAVLIAMYFSMDYKGPNDNAIAENLSGGMLQQIAQGKQPTPEMQQEATSFGRSVINALKDDRRSLYGGDLLRSAIFILLAAGLLAYYQKKNISSQIVVLGLVVLSAIDLLGVDLRYLTHKNYHPADEATELVATRADLQIKQDTGYYRVLDQTGGNPFLDSRASYFHNSVGGQHPARLALYDDLMQRQLTRGNMQAYNMLNTKYIIVSNPQDRQPMAQLNPDALGPCWLVKTIKYVNNADEEMSALDTFNPKDTVVIDKREKSKVPFAPQFDSTASIRLIQNLNDDITYEFNAATNQFAVFSEIYYPAGWKAFIDGKETPIVKVNYLLRGLPVPAGKHAIRFHFEPEKYVIGNQVSLIAGIISILCIVAGVLYLWKKNK